MKNRKLSVVLSLSLLMLISANSSGQEIPATDRRATEIRHLDLTYTFTPYNTREEWEARARSLRHQIMVSAGLWPLPAKTPLNAQIFGRVERGDYTVEKVYFESYPGHYVTGNLYRPKNVTGKVPAVLLPHGHWTYGRLENQQLNSGPTRAANFARLGFVAFTWDMVGYVDSAAVPHTFANHREGLIRESLWGVNLLGLQLWNSIRSVDFVASLPEADPERIGCTGESGGGTQTFLLSAVDDRIKVSAPVNMISATMQGGSVCENAPNLRIDTNNMEIGALMAPRPMLMIAATGDWTKNTPTVEYPAIKSVYELFGAADKVQYAQFDAPHNYHRESREAVYGWFAHWFTGRKETTPIKEQGVGSLTLNDLLVFYGRPRPANELNEQQLTASLIQMRRKQFEEAWPRDAAGLERFKEQYGTALKYALMAEYPKPETISAATVPTNVTAAGVRTESLVISRTGKPERLFINIFHSIQKKSGADESFVLVVNGWTNEADRMYPLAIGLARGGHTVFQLHAFQGVGRGEAKGNLKFISGYNRTDAAYRVQDVLTAIAYLRQRNNSARLSVLGDLDSIGTVMHARSLSPQIDRMVVDASHFDNTSDDEFLKRLPVPDLLRAGDFATAVAIAPKTPLLIHNTGNHFQTDKIAEAYRRFGKAEDLQIKSEQLTDAQIIEWLKRH